MNITVKNDSEILYDGIAYTNFALFKGKLGEVKPLGSIFRSTLCVSDGKDKNGEWKPSIWVDLVMQTAFGGHQKGDVITVRCKYQQKDDEKDGKKVRYHSYYVFDVWGDKPSDKLAFDI